MEGAFCIFVPLRESQVVARVCVCVGGGANAHPTFQKGS